MSEEHTDNLKKALARLIEQRRAFVKVLAGPYERGKTEQARERFLDIYDAYNHGTPTQRYGERRSTETRNALATYSN
jgi:hypothetical protein